MPYFSKRSQERLATCDSHLQALFNEIIRKRDCTILEGHRGKKRQNELFAEGKSKLEYPKGKHNKNPSEAVDVAPYFPGIGVSFNRQDCIYFAGYVMGIAGAMNINIRNGADWNRNEQVSDERFLDILHFEIIPRN